MLNPIIPRCRPLFGITLLSTGLAAAFAATGLSQNAEYDVRSATRDRVKAVSGNARLGSFGAPAINDRGNIAFPAVLFGKSVQATSQYSVAYQAANRRNAKIALQGGISQASLQLQNPPKSDSRTLSNSFLVDTTSIEAVPGSARMFRITRNVAINRRNQIAFAGEMIQAEVSGGENPTLSNKAYSTFGLVVPNRATFGNIGLSRYIEFFEGILSRVLSVNPIGAVPFSASFLLTTEQGVSGFGFRSPTVVRAPVATVQSTVIGLPYFTTFASFTDPVIAKNNRCFVVASLSETGSEFDGIWQGTNANLKPVVVKDRRAPNGGTFASFDGTVAPSPNAKAIAFIANVTGGNTSRAVFRSNLTGEQISRIAGVGLAAPGAPGPFQELTAAATNNRGNVAIQGAVNVSGRTRTGIWLSDKDGQNLRLMAIEGQTIKVGRRDKTISRITFNPISGLNNRGAIAFTASFTDRTSAVIVAR